MTVSNSNGSTNRILTKSNQKNEWLVLKLNYYHFLVLIAYFLINFCVILMKTPPRNNLTSSLRKLHVKLEIKKHAINKQHKILGTKIYTEARRAH